MLNTVRKIKGSECSAIQHRKSRSQKYVMSRVPLATVSWKRTKKDNCATYEKNAERTEREAEKSKTGKQEETTGKGDKCCKWISRAIGFKSFLFFCSSHPSIHSFINPMFFTWINSTQFEGEENKNKNSRKINNCWRSRKKFLKFFVSHLHSCMFISLLLCQLKERKAIYLTITLPWKRKDARNDEMINFDEIRNRREARQGWRNVSRMLWVVCLNY